VIEITGSPIRLTTMGASVWSTAAALVAAVVFVSSLVDWYWILPRLGGIGDWPRPCTVEVPNDRHNWRFLTQFWYGHRLLAEFLSVATIEASAVYLAATDDANRGLWIPLAAVCTLGAGRFIPSWLGCWGNVHNPEVQVGSVIRVARVGWEPSARELYVVDVDLRGIQCMFIDEARLELDGAANPEQAFQSKKETTSIKPGEHVDPLATYRPPCSDHCTGINWYCSNNPRAYEPR
jgi:hypothetical protein